MDETVLYFDCAGGVSGDMTLGALLDLGVSLDSLKKELGKLDIRGYRLVASKASRSGIRGTRLRVETPNDRGYRHYADFSRIIEKSRLSSSIKEQSLALIGRIFSAEAKVHGKRIESIHLHELGSMDTLIDVVGTLVALDLLGNPAVECSPVNVGGGMVQTEHGLMPVPAPATALLLKGAPVFTDGSDFERTTPTGALLVTGLARRFGPWPAMTLLKLGYGVGSKDPKDGAPNHLRIAQGKRRGRALPNVLVIETTIDDMSPEIAGHLSDRLFQAGALDVFITPVQMKKSRPGVNVTVVADPEKRPSLTEIIFRESTTLGLRFHEVEREELERKQVRVSTRYGKVSVKLGLSGGEVVNIAPEFEDCRRIAASKRVAIKVVQQAAMAAFSEGDYSKK
jgi:uncharacterized protein (TIGR00299 family) protein